MVLQKNLVGNIRSKCTHIMTIIDIINVLDRRKARPTIIADQVNKSQRPHGRRFAIMQSTFQKAGSSCDLAK